MANATQAKSLPTSDFRKLVPPNGWIIGPREDFVLFLGTPLFLIVVFGVAQSFWSIAGLSVFATILAMGHYLPGLMRAYGDPVLFKRYPLRFLLAPVLFLSTALYMAKHESQTFLMVVVIWGAWHWLMQTYGLVRIYDAKAKNFDSTSARLDYALCISWFGVLYWQTDGTTGVLMRYYRAGGMLPADFVRIGAQLWFAGTIAVSVVYLIHVFRKIRIGQPPSILKIALLGVSFLFYLYAFGYSSSKLVAFGLFEGYHDIQYLAIVWVFNRNRATQPDAGSFTRFLFRQRWPLAVLYVFLCVGFGSYDFFARSVDDAAIAQLALGLITGFALIHFYFDGFIWRIREPNTRKTLGVDGSEPARSRVRISPSVRHGLIWAGCLVPVALLFMWELAGGVPSDIDACRSVLAARPGSHKAHYQISSLLKYDNELDALTHIEEARKLRPGYDLYEMLYADLLLAQGRTDPETLDVIIQSYQSALSTRPNVVNLHRNLAASLSMRGRFAESVPHSREAIRLEPNHAATHVELGNSLARLRQFDAAAQAYADAVSIDPDNADAHAVLATICMAQNQPEEAFDHYRQALRVDPGRVRVMVNFALALATVNDASMRDSAEATHLADAARDLLTDSGNRAIWRDLATTYAALGNMKAARAAAEQAGVSLPKR